jgi:hypothetical protein
MNAARAAEGHEEAAMHIAIEWTRLEDEGDPLWEETQSLYAYADPDTGELLYVGKADYQTVRQRLYGPHKEHLFDDLKLDEVDVFHGALVLEARRRLTSGLLGDVEALLIMELQPPGNVAYKESRPSRPGITVACTGDWPWVPAMFEDE